MPAAFDIETDPLAILAAVGGHSRAGEGASLSHS
jgi:hypothetical protein